MKRLILLVVLGVLALAVTGGVLWISGVGLDPIKFVRDTLTGFQSNHPRHQVSASQAVRWDPVGDHNAAVEAVPVGDRAFPVLAEYAGRAEAMRDEAWGNKGGFAPDFSRAEPGDPEWATLVAWLEGEDARELTRLITEAASRPVFGQPLSVRGVPLWDDTVRRHGGTVLDDPSPPPANPLVYNMLLPAFGPATGGLTVLDARARLAVERNDREGLVAALRPMVSMAELVADPPLMISQFVAARYRMMVRSRIERVLSEKPELIDEPTAALMDGWLALDLRPSVILPDATGELISFEDILRRMVDDRGVFVPSNAGPTMDALNDSDLDVSPPSTAPLAAFNADLLASYEMLRRHTDAGLAGLEIPWTPIDLTDADADVWVKQPDSIPGQIGRRLIGVLLLDWQTPAHTFRKARQNTLGLRVALAAHRHRLRHGEAPASLDGIDPDLLAFEPIDGFTGGRLVYRWTGDTHLVYACGADGDDDGGRRAADPESVAVPFISDDYLRGKWDGDWVVFPPRE
jgi:hypothetical protein